VNFLHLDDHALRQLANSINPLLTVLFLVALFQRAFVARGDRTFHAGECFLRAVLSLIVAFGLGRVNEALRIWPGLPLDPGRYEFPSGHMCYAVSVATSLVMLNRRYLFFVVPLLGFYGALIVFLRFHGWIDVIGAWVLMTPLAWIIHQPARQVANEQDA
jgi:membrane-associated phospholipid phosphatase